MAKNKTVKKKPPKKKRVTRTSRRQKPMVVSIVACDSVVQQVPSGKPSLIGIFDRIQVVDPAKPFRQFSVLTKLFGGKGIFRVGMIIKTPKGSLIKGTVKDAELDLKSESFNQGIATVVELDVSQSGIYMIYVSLDGKPFGNPCPIEVVHVQPRENDVSKQN